MISKREQRYRQIAKKVTKETATGGGTVTPEQVAAIANGTDRNLSHPVHQAVLIELRWFRPR